MLDLKTRCNRGKGDQAATPLTAKLRTTAQKLCAVGMTDSSTTRDWHATQKLSTNRTHDGTTLLEQINKTAY